MQAIDVMTTDVVSVKPETSVREIAELLLSKRISGVPVVDAEGRVVGVVSEGDLMRRLEDDDGSDGSWWLARLASAGGGPEDYVKAHGRHARDVMTRNVVEVSKDAPVAEIARILEQRRIKRVPVTDSGRLVGIVSRANLLHGLAAETPGEAGSADDREIRERVESALAEVDGLDAALINVIVSNGVVQLWGLVPSDAQREAARVAAENASGVRSVDNNIGQAPEWIWGV